MKVLIINGSPRPISNTAVALEEMNTVFVAAGIDVEIVQIGNMDIRGCIACGYCAKNGKCVFNDIVNELATKLNEADGFVVASPVYFAAPNATLMACLDRLMWSTKFLNKTMKVAASVVCARRSGCSSTFDVLNKFLSESGMAIATSQYWNNIHGREPGQAVEDEEGRQTARVLARNMVFLMRSIEKGKELFGLPQKEERLRTNFIR